MVLNNTIQNTCVMITAVNGSYHNLLTIYLLCITTQYVIIYYIVYIKTLISQWLWQEIQKELDTFVNYLNQEYKLNLEDQKVVELNGWKTVNM